MITFWILYSYLVPISLFVTLEIVKFWQGFLYINHDKEMKVGSSFYNTLLSQAFLVFQCETAVLHAVLQSVQSLSAHFASPAGKHHASATWSIVCA